MATVRINATQSDRLIPSSSSPSFGTLGTTSTSSGAPSLSNIFGHNAINNCAYLFVFQGVIPSDFNTFTSVSTRQSDLLVVIPLRFIVTATGSNSSRWFAATSNGTSRSFNINNSAGSLVRSSNVVTVTLAALTNDNPGLVPGQSITISGVTTDTSFNGTFTVASVPSATTFTFNQTGSNASVVGSPGTITIPYQAILSGTAAWFCMCRTNSTWIPSSAFTGFGAMIGTVGAFGSGSDLEIITTSITLGTTYTSAGMYINMPWNWTV